MPTLKLAENPPQRSAWKDVLSAAGSGARLPTLRIYDDTFPLLVGVGPKRFDEESVREMADAYEPYFRGAERYAVLTATPRDAVLPDARARRLMTDWLNSPRVRDCTRRLCVGTATIVPSTVTRGALTALLWFWTPGSPLKPVATVDEGLDYCFERMRIERVKLSDEAAVRKLVGERLRDIV